MVMSWIFTVILAMSVIASAITGNGKALGNAVLSGAQSGVQLAISMAGAICLWSGLGKVMERNGMSFMLAKLLRPILYRIFPSSAKDPTLAGDLSANICANILGLGNAATPMGIRAAKGMAKPEHRGIASDELCRLIVLNTASIQLIPGNVAAIRASLGAVSPFDILPAVWITCLCSAGFGLCAAWALGKLWKND